MKSKNFGVYFLMLVLIIYLIVFFNNSENFYSGLNSALEIFQKVILVFILVFFLTAAFNYFLTQKKIKKYFRRKSRRKSWFLAVIFGILSMGPIYAWYPFLSELKNKGVNSGLISVFLYNRSIKLPLFPMMIFYFGVPYVLILGILMIFASIIQGRIVEKLIDKNEN